MKRIVILITGVMLIGCQTISQHGKNTKLTNASLIYDNTSAFKFQGRKSHAWVSDKFTGKHSRQISDNILTFIVDQTHEKGGLDVGLSKPGIQPSRSTDVSHDAKICSSYDISLTGEGRWWAGPKISVNWQGDESAKQNGDDWYENYIIEIASTSPAQLHDILTDDYFSFEILPDTVWAGATYRNYKIRFHDWWQFWSVRQDYRETGTVPIKPILEFWAEHGMPSVRKFDGVKANIETYGAVNGTGRLAVDVTIQADEDLDCPI